MVLDQLTRAQLIQINILLLFASVSRFFNFFLKFSRLALHGVVGCAPGVPPGFLGKEDQPVPHCLCCVRRGHPWPPPYVRYILLRKACLCFTKHSPVSELRNLILYSYSLEVYLCILSRCIAFSLSQIAYLCHSISFLLLMEFV